MHEFEIDPNNEIVLSGQIRINLPDYMHCLSGEDAENLRRLPIKNRMKRLIAVGLEPKSGDMVGISASGNFYELNSKQYNLPCIRCMLGDVGQVILFEDKTELAVDWFLTNAKKLHLNIDMFG